MLFLTSCTYFDVQTGTKTNLFLSCLCLWDGAFGRILYFGVHTGTKTNLFLVVYVYGMVVLVALYALVYKQAPIIPIFSCLFYRVVLFLTSCTSMYNQATKQAYFLVVYVVVASCSSVYKPTSKHTHI